VDDAWVRRDWAAPSVVAHGEIVLLGEGGVARPSGRCMCGDRLPCLVLLLGPGDDVVVLDRPAAPPRPTEQAATGTG